MVSSHIRSKMRDDNWAGGLIGVLELGGPHVVAYSVIKDAICVWNGSNNFQVWEEVWDASYESWWEKRADLIVSLMPTYQQARLEGINFLNTHFHIDDSK
jgi:hypothetical protein